MDNRTKGEETFVVINTTGEPLSATENLKPLLINQQPKEAQNLCAENWEKWEQFFWKTRGKNDTADNGLKEFFRWIMLLALDSTNDKFKQIQKDGTFKFDLNIRFDTINKYFDIVSEKLFPSGKTALFPNNKEWLSPDIDGNDQITWFRVLPVIQYLYRFSEALEKDVWRVRMFFRNLAKIPNIQKAIKDVLPEAIRIIKEMPSKDLCSILQLDDVSKTLITDETKLKLQILSYNQQREDVEKAFWEEEEHMIWCGEIMPLLKWSTTENGFNFELFKIYAKKFNKIFHDTLEYEELDITRRALLTMALNDYPRYFKGNTNKSFAWEYEDWHTLIFDNIEQFKLFFDALDINDIYKAQKEMISSNPKDKDYDEFVKIPELLKYCEQKNIQWWGVELGWTLVKGERAGKTRGEHANLKSYKLYLELKDLDSFKKNHVWYSGKPDDYKDDCAVIDETQDRNTWAIDIWHSGNDKYALQLFQRIGKTENRYGDLPKKLDLSWNGKRYEKENLEKEDVINMVKTIVILLQAIAS